MNTRDASAHGPGAVIEALETRRLLTLVGPEQPTLTALAIDADTVRLSYSKTDDSVLSLEMKGPGDANYRAMNYLLNQTAGTHTLDINSLAAARSYSFRLRAALNGAVAYDDANARTDSLWQADPSPTLAKPEVAAVSDPWGYVEFSFEDGPYPTYAPDDPWAAFDLDVEIVGGDPFGLFDYAGAYYWFNPVLTDGMWNGEFMADYSPYGYAFRLKVDAGSDGSPWSDWTRFTVSSPNAPAAPELSIAPAGGGNVTVSWTDVWNDNDAYLNFYRVIGDEATLIEDDVEADDGSIVLPAGAVDAQIFAAAYISGYGFSLYSNFLAADGVPDAPAPPSGLEAVGDLFTATEREIRLLWTDNSSNETGFLIEASVDSVNWSFFAQTASDVASFTGELPENGLDYSFRVTALAGVLASAPSAQAIPLIANRTFKVSEGNQWIVWRNFTDKEKSVEITLALHGKGTVVWEFWDEDGEVQTLTEMFDSTGLPQGASLTRAGKIASCTVKANKGSEVRGEYEVEK